MIISFVKVFNPFWFHWALLNAQCLCFFNPLKVFDPDSLKKLMWRQVTLVHDASDASGQSKTFQLISCYSYTGGMRTTICSPLHTYIIKLSHRWPTRWSLHLVQCTIRYVWISEMVWKIIEYFLCHDFNIII